MKNNYQFISGLPRSGSTLLAAILRQNPNFHARMTSPVAPLISAVQAKMSGGEFEGFFTDVTRMNVMKGIFESYYSGLSGDSRHATVFDTNRSWTARIALISRLYPDSRIICCVRDIGWIIDSIEAMLAKNPAQHSRMFNFKPGASVSSRAETLMHPEHGQIGCAWHSLRDAWYSEFASRLIIVTYESLVTRPRSVINKIYEEIEQPEFGHEFENIEYDEPDFDRKIGMPGMHTVGKKVELVKRQICIPPDVFLKYDGMHFWKFADKNTRGVTIL